MCVHLVRQQITTDYTLFDNYATLSHPYMAYLLPQKFEYQTFCDQNYFVVIVIPCSSHFNDELKDIEFQSCDIPLIRKLPDQWYV